GDRVEQGQLLTLLEPLRAEPLDARSRAEARARVAAARAALAAAGQQVLAAQAEEALARSELARIQALANRQLAAVEELQQAEAAATRAIAALRSAQFRVAVSQHELEAAETRLSVSTAVGEEGAELVAIRAPVSGAVLQRLRQSEGVVVPAQPLLEIGDPYALEVVVEVQSFDAVRIQPGMEVRLTGWGGEPLQAQVQTVEPVGFTEVSALGVEEQRVRVVLAMVSAREQWALLGDGYRVDAHFILWRSDNELVIPESAVFRRDGVSQAFVVEDGVARLRSVETGRGDGFRISIHAGIEQGDEVVRHPDNSLGDGVRVRSRL
ncbi:MAG TPA: HlyD family efflux transporter periplasmic adaptor subunit, partial [Kineobactrum sp.]